MTGLLRALRDRAVTVVGLGAILVAVSEVWFYEVSPDTHWGGIVVVYGLLATLFLAVLDRFAVRGLAGLVVSAALLGLLIEGVAVPVVYSAPPFTIVWTSLAWHGLISIGLGWLGLRRLLAGPPLRAAMATAAAGVFLGLWGAYIWSAREMPGSPELAWDWPPVGPFATQFLWGYALFLAGHLLFDRFRPRTPFSRAEHLTLWALAAAVSVLTAVASGLLLFFPVLPALVVLCLWALARRGGMGQGALDWAYAAPLPIWRLILTLPVPALALPTFAAITNARLAVEMNVVVILTAGPLSVGLFLWALWCLVRRRAD